ncbi:glycoside hydrolase family 15 protein [Nocardia abscessus]|uniref:glycoside hydrolase family 15 protein n=2 Tax=Nocardia abscessus TaxID=120957 RepID=UPI0012F96762|nr:glycoside hydrolase family 15 protein [Nocardia abscessus]MCC3332225.1 glycoside hydrolase family 15 protein [Nocardia abscessus]
MAYQPLVVEPDGSVEPNPTLSPGRLDGGPVGREREWPLHGYRGSRPVRTGNAAAEQVQLDTYGELLQTGFLYANAVGRLDADVARRLAQLADFVCANWQRGRLRSPCVAHGSTGASSPRLV